MRHIIHKMHPRRVWVKICIPPTKQSISSGTMFFGLAAISWILMMCAGILLIDVSTLCVLLFMFICLSYRIFTEYY